MVNFVFFYGTLMTALERPERVRLDPLLVPVGRGWIHASLFDLGIYPAAVPASDSRVRGEVYRMLGAEAALSFLDEFEGYRAGETSTNLFTRVETAVTFDDGRVTNAWVYFYNAPLSRAERIESGDYLEHLKAK